MAVANFGYDLDFSLKFSEALVLPWLTSFDSLFLTNLSSFSMWNTVLYHP